MAHPEMTLPEGITRRPCGDSGVSVPLPDSWSLRMSMTGQQKFFSAGPEVPSGMMPTTFFRLSVYPNSTEINGKPASEAASQWVDTILLEGSNPWISETDGSLVSYERLAQTSFPGDRPSYILLRLIADQATDTLYQFSFHTPAEQWEEQEHLAHLMVSGPTIDPSPPK